MLKLQYPQDEPWVQKYHWLQENNKSVDGKTMFTMEREFIVGYEPRINFISALCKKLEGNKLILFINVKDQYGARIADRIRDWNPDCYYIDGEVGDTDRASYKNAMEKGQGVVLVASYGTFSTGIDLKNVNHIIFAESYKSEITIRQSIGRGMRQLAGKHQVVVYDLIDDLRGYIVKHGAAREKIYNREKFIVSKHSYDLSKFL